MGDVVTKRRIALVAEAGDSRSALADYLISAGFDVHQYDELAMPSAFTALVLIGRREESSDSVVETVRSWIKLTKTQRLVVVTSKPKALAGLIASYSERLRVLPAPAFGWDVVDALRSSASPAPKGA
jgi:hypothetical protein